MGVLALPRERSSERGLRPLNVLTDLDAVSRLLDIVFGQEATHGDSRIHQDLQALMAVSPMLWLLGRISDEVRDALAGYVWVEGGRLIGNVTLTRDDPTRKVWTIANVAVHPNYRRRGIGRALMQQAIAHVEQRGGGLVALRVAADNRPALALYEHLGFRRLDGMVTARSHAMGRPTQGLDAVAHPVASPEWRQVLRLLQESTPPMAQEIAPVREGDVRPGLLAGLRQLWRQEQVTWLGMWMGDGLAAAANVRVSRRGRRCIASLVLRPDAPGDMVAPLVAGLLELCRESSRMEITVRVASEREDARACLRVLGFAEIADELRLVLRADADA